MMKKYKSILTLLLASVMLLSTSCRDDFADLNRDPAAVNTGTPAFLFTQGIMEFEPSGYTYWFYNASEMFQWIQMGVTFGTASTSLGVSSTLTDGAPVQGFKSIDVLKYRNELEWVLSEMPEEERVLYNGYWQCLDILCIYMGIFDSDFIGNIPYTESARFIHGGTLTPKYDKVADLYDLWLTRLDENIKYLTNPDIKIDILDDQDPIYRGNTAKWAKLANSLKLKIAARLISRDRARALTLVNQVVTSPVGVIDGEDDDFLFNKATDTSTGNREYVYHWENDVLRSLAGSESIMKFFVDNKDPRVRFIFCKNDWNSKIVEAFMNAGRMKDIPHYIFDNVEYEEIKTQDDKGKDIITYKFKNWKGVGEPWVRYQGLPLAFNAGQNAGVYGDWFSYSSQCRLGDVTYYPFSQYQKEMIYGRVDFTLKTAPGDAAIQDKDDIPWWGVYMSTAEVNLYLAEFALLGATGLGNAEDYYKKAIAASVSEYDRLASKNKIPYYGTTYNYDPHEVAIDLQAGEIDNLLLQPDYQLTGTTAEKLEKVYLQQLLHFFMQPIDMYTTARRSGVPMFNSSVFPRVDYTDNGIPASSIPRRMALSQPSQTDLMYNILMESYKEQGFTVGSGENLNSQRIWQDVDAPQWGEGPKQ